MKRGSKRIVFLLAFAAFAASVSAETITLKTTDSLHDLAQKWAEAYAAKHAGTKIEVSGGGAPAAFAALAERKVNLALAPRAIRFKEAQACEAAFGSRPTEFKVAVNGAAVYVNAGNPVKVLTYDEIEGAFKGKFTNWKRLAGADAPITLYGVDTNTAPGELFVADVLKGGTPTNTLQIMSSKSLLAAIARDTNSIGFGPLTPAEGVRPLEIKRAYSSTPVAPSEESIANKIFPISRFVFCYVEPSANKEEIKTFLDWLRSDDGQLVAKQAGFFALPAKWRE